MSAKRLKIFIFSFMAVIALLCLTLVTVSFARWDIDDISTVRASGKVGKYYVEYPRYVSGAASGIVVPDLADDVYYMQVQKDGGMSDYYMMEDHPTNPAEKKLKNVYLTAGTVIDMYFGTTKDSIRNRNGASSIEFQHVSNDTAATGKVTKTGYYDFYYEYQWHTMYAHYSGDVSDDVGGGSSGGTGMATPKRDTSKRSVKVNFNNGSAIVFEAINHDWDSAGIVNFHIWQEGGVGTTWPGLSMDKNADSADNTVTLACSPAKITGIIISCIYSQTGEGSDFFDEKFPNGLKANYTYTFDLQLLHHSQQYSTSFPDISVTEKAPSGGGGGSITPITPAEPYTTGSTVFTAKLNGDKVVRNVSATMKEDGDSYTYHNYICVSRKNSEISLNDNSIAYVFFEVAAKGTTDLSAVKVKSITLTRKNTDNKGNPTSGTIDPAPRLYGVEDIKKLSDINFSTDSGDTSKHQVATFYNGGMYCILFFGDNKQQYFALDIIIETYDPAEFSLTATASNVNHWKRYESGYGEPWTYYLGGLINDVKTWEPSRTTQLNINGKTGQVKYDKAVEDAYLASHSIAHLNAASQFNYKINIENSYNSATGEMEDVVVRYPKGEVDITLTVNLTGGSNVKAYMLDKTGARGANSLTGTVYLLPKQIVSFPEDLFDGNIFDSDLNLVIPEGKSGEYSFRFVGHIDTSYVGQYMNFADGKIESGKESDANGKTIDQYNYVIDKLYIQRAATVGAMIDVTFDPGEGSFKPGITVETTQQVRFGNSVNMKLAPKEEHLDVPADHKFDGWYFTDEDGTVAEYDGEPILGPTTLTAHYSSTLVTYHTVTFDSNGGSAVASATVANGSTVEKPADPTKDNYNFGGWYTTSALAAEYDFDTPVTGDITLHAKWTPKVQTGTNDWYVVGTMNSWTIKSDCYIASNSYIEVTFERNAEFKIAKASSDGGIDWSKNYGYSGAQCSNGVTSGSDGNIKITDAGTYVVGFYENKIYVAKKVQTVKINNTLIVVTNQTNNNLWMWNTSNSSQNFTGGTWPGKAFSAQSEYTVSVNVSFIVNGSAGQTADLHLTQNTSKAYKYSDSNFTIFTFGGTIST